MPCRHFWSVVFMSCIFMSGIFMSCNFMLCNFDGSPFSPPAFSVNPCTVRTLWEKITYLKGHTLTCTALHCANRPCKMFSDLVVLKGVVGCIDLCSPGWSCYSSRCYYVSTDKAIQPTARDLCRSQNADLVSISDSTENDFVTSIWSVC